MPYQTNKRTKCGYLDSPTNKQDQRRQTPPHPSRHFVDLTPPSLAARYLEKKTRRFFDLFCAPPRSCFPGFTRVDPTIDQTKRSGLKKSGWLKLLAGFTRKRASTRRVKRKIADSTRNQRVFFSRYLAAKYAGRHDSAQAIGSLGPNLKPRVHPRREPRIGGNV